VRFCRKANSDKK
jgi:hypothetical protein